MSLLLLTAVMTMSACDGAKSIQQKESSLYGEDELEAIALTLAGECYDDRTADKRLVCEVILNRVSNGNFGKTVVEVVAAPNQFNGYRAQSRPVSPNDYAVAKQMLENWYKNDCKAFSGYLYFSAGSNRENSFRKEF